MQVTIDGHKSCLEAVEATFGADIDDAIRVKSALRFGRPARALTATAIAYSRPLSSRDPDRDPTVSPNSDTTEGIFRFKRGGPRNDLLS